MPVPTAISFDVDCSVVSAGGPSDGWWRLTKRGGGSGGVRWAWGVSMHGKSVLDTISGSTLSGSNNWASGVQNPTQAEGDLDGDGDLDVMFAQFGLELAVVS